MICEPSSDFLGILWKHQTYAGQVMELLEGPDLFDFLAERSSKLEEVKAVGLVRPADR
jgi:hypothetical protein